MSTGKEFAPQFYIRIFSRGYGEIDLKNVISIKTNHNLNSPAGNFSIELDYRESGFGALDSFFRIEPMDLVEIYLRRNPGGIGRWTEVKKLTSGNFTEKGKIIPCRDTNGNWTVRPSKEDTEYKTGTIETKNIVGIDFFSRSNYQQDEDGIHLTNPTNITIGKLDFIKDKPLTFSERIYNPDLVMVGFVDKVGNNFGLSENGTQNRVTIQGRTVAKFLQLHAITQEITKLVLGNKEVISEVTEQEIRNRTDIPNSVKNIMIQVLNLVVVRYNKLINLPPNEAAWVVFEEYVAKILGNTKPKNYTWQSVGEPLEKSQYDIEFGPSAISKLLVSDLSTDRVFNGFDERFVELENPEIDPDIINNNSNLEIVRDVEELQSRSGYSISQRDRRNLTTLHFYDAPWTYIYTSFNIDSAKDPYSRIAKDVGPRGGVDWSNPGLGNGNFFSPVFGILQRLGNGNINEIFVDEKGFVTLRRRINAFDQTRFLKTNYKFLIGGAIGQETKGGFVDKKYGAYKGIEDDHNRIIINDGSILNWNFNRSDDNLKSVVIIKPSMLANGGTQSYHIGWRTTMPQTFNNIFENINFEAESSKFGKISNDDQVLQNISQDLPKSILEFVTLKDVDSALKAKVVETLYKNKFSSIFSPPLRSEFQILNFWQRYGFRTLVAEDFFSSNSSYAQLTAVELFEKYNNSWWNGEITVMGDPKYRAGKVVEFPSIPAKFYCFSVNHNFDWGNGTYKTTIGVMMGKLIKTPTSESKNGKRSKYAETLLNNIKNVPIIGGENNIGSGFVS